MTFAPRHWAVFFGLILFTFNQIQSADPAPANRYRWPGGVIPFVIGDDVPHTERIDAAMRQWAEITPIRLVPRTDQRNYVRFIRENNDGLCFSSIGMLGGDTMVKHGNKCGVGVSDAHRV